MRITIFQLCSFSMYEEVDFEKFQSKLDNIQTNPKVPMPVSNLPKPT